jgi:hypothetical protein
MSGGGGSVTLTTSLPIPSGKLEVDEGVDVAKLQLEICMVSSNKTIRNGKTFFMMITSPAVQFYT